MDLLRWPFHLYREALPPDRATADDIRYCFRLLLGREPNPEEVRGHFARVGEPLASVVASYLGSRGFQRRELLAPSKGARELVRSDSFSIWVDRNDLDIGAHFSPGSYEPHVTAEIKTRLKAGMGNVNCSVSAGKGY